MLKSAFTPDKYLFLSAGDSAHVLAESSLSADYGGLVSAGPFDLESGEVREVVYAIVAGSSLDAIRTAVDLAGTRYPFEAPLGAGESDILGHSLVRLEPNRPNPFSSITGLRFYLPRAGKADLAVFDIRGRRVRQLARGELTQGWHEVVWDGTDRAGRRVTAGVYFSRLRTESDRLSRRMIRIR